MTKQELEDINAELVELLQILTDQIKAKLDELGVADDDQNDDDDN